MSSLQPSLQIEVEDVTIVKKVDIVAELIHTPAEDHPLDEAEEYSFRSRWRRGRRIPSSFIKKDDEGGFTIKSQVRGSRQLYHIWKTVFGKWMCTCHDFSFHHRPCKHCIKVALYINGSPDEQSRIDRLLERILRSQDRLFTYTWRDKDFAYY